MGSYWGKAVQHILLLPQHSCRASLTSFFMRRHKTKIIKSTCTEPLKFLLWTKKSADTNFSAILASSYLGSGKAVRPNWHPWDCFAGNVEGWGEHWLVAAVQVMPPLCINMSRLPFPLQSPRCDCKSLAVKSVYDFWVEIFDFKIRDHAVDH